MATAMPSSITLAALAAALSLAVSSARAQTPSTHLDVPRAQPSTVPRLLLTMSDAELEREYRALQEQGGPQLWPSALLILPGLLVGAVGGVVAGVGAGLSTTTRPCFFYCSGGYIVDDPSPYYTAATALGVVGGTALVAGLIWLLERGGPYRADAPRRDRIRDLRLERRRRARDARTHRSNLVLKPPCPDPPRE